MDESRTAPDQPSEAPFLQRMFDSPFLLLGLGMIIMLVLFTFWGLWEIMNLPTATLP
jgi:hypothetical protein